MHVLEKACASLLCLYKAWLENTQVTNASIFNYDLPVVSEGKIMQIGPESEQGAPLYSPENASI